MPRLSETILHSTFFLYRSKDDAVRGVDCGGTGFAVYMPSDSVEDISYFYGVTNWHVAVRDGCSVIRLNSLDGSTDILELGPEDWVFDTNGDDLAIAPIQSDFNRHALTPIPIALIYPRNLLHDRSGMNVGLGDDVVMVGRFVDLENGPSNLPTARFGNISASLVHIPQSAPTAGPRESYCLDMHSRTGFSGSPVFIYRTPGSDLVRHLEMNAPELRSAMFALLGVNFGQFLEQWRIRGQTGTVVEGVSGMTGVIPAWRIRDLLSLTALASQREDSDEKWKPRSPEVQT